MWKKILNTNEMKVMKNGSENMTAQRTQLKSHDYKCFHTLT